MDDIMSAIEWDGIGLGETLRFPPAFSGFLVELFDAETRQFTFSALRDFWKAPARHFVGGILFPSEGDGGFWLSQQSYSDLGLDGFFDAHGHLGLHLCDVPWKTHI
jgi:hypothetical protein